MVHYSSNFAVELLRTYLRIASVHPNIDYEPCLNFLHTQADDLGLIYNVYRPLPDFPHAVLTWTGREPSLPSIILNSHMDVASVFEDQWSHKPFDADIDEKGDIYARGVQDTKALGIQYLEAIRRLKKKGFQPKRTIHVTFASEEELSGGNGVKLFVKTPEFRALNAGFALDEGAASENNVSGAYYGEKRGWKFSIHCTGQPGHGLMLLDNTAGEKVQYLLNKFYEYRAEQKYLMEKQQNGENITTINLTMMKGGVQNNVIPDKFVIVFDTHVPIQDFAIFEAQVNQWCREAGTGITIEDFIKDDEVPHTPTDDSNIYWVAFKKALQSLNVPVETRITPANTDGRYFRGAGIPTIGYSPSLNTPIRIHGNDEYLSVDEFLAGISKFETIIPAIADV